jgi:hypothetical protein
LEKRTLEARRASVDGQDETMRMVV